MYTQVSANEGGAMSALISPPAPGGPVGRLLRSRLAAALTTPHGVDRYLERFNPMWAAHEVRARVVSEIGRAHV